MSKTGSRLGFFFFFAAIYGLCFRVLDFRTAFRIEESVVELDPALLRMLNCVAPSYLFHG